MTLYNTSDVEAIIVDGVGRMVLKNNPHTYVGWSKEYCDYYFASAKAVGQRYKPSASTNIKNGDIWVQIPK